MKGRRDSVFVSASGVTAGDGSESSAESAELAGVGAGDGHEDGFAFRDAVFDDGPEVVGDAEGYDSRFEGAVGVGDEEDGFVDGAE